MRKKLSAAMLLTLVVAGLSVDSAFAGNDDRHGYKSWGRPFLTILKKIHRLEIRLDELEEENAELRAQLACVSGESDAYDVFFDGCNVHVRNGVGSTNSLNTKGNLIIGYNEDGGNLKDRTGSHNLVIGEEHTYSAYGGLVAGYRNAVTGDNATVSGGFENTASNLQASVSGGRLNVASAVRSSVSGGRANIASGISSSVSGGIANSATGDDGSSIGGGRENTASGVQSSVSGGYRNDASGLRASVSGGRENLAEGENSTVSGGSNNAATLPDSHKP